MLKHDFGIVGEKKEVFLEDNLILYMMDSFEWIKTLSKLEENVEKYGLNYYGITYFKEESITKLKNIILHWINIFSLGEDVIELRGMYYVNIGKQSYNKYKKNNLKEFFIKIQMILRVSQKKIYIGKFYLQILIKKKI